MTSGTIITRQQHVQKLAAFCQGLNKALAQVGLVAEKWDETWRTAVAAKCVECGLEVSGDELFALSQPPSAERANVKIGRLRLGDCARKGCTSYYYHVTFQPYLELNWQELLSQVEIITKEEAKEATREPISSAHAISLLWRLPGPRRVGIACLLVLVILLARQWYIGGRIPWLREPEKFLIDPESMPQISR